MGPRDKVLLVGPLSRDQQLVRSLVSSFEVLEPVESASPFGLVGPELAILDLETSESLRLISLAPSETRVLVLYDSDEPEHAREFLRAGAYDIIARPVSASELLVRAERALSDRRAREAKRRKSHSKRRPRKSDVIIGGESWTKSLFESLSMVAPTDVTVAISGESGTGKELVARTVHSLSARFERPFVVVNCAAIPENLLEDELFGHVRGAFTDASSDRQGLFAAADGGTLFLDEIGEMSLGLQAKLLRVLQSQEFRRVGEDKDTRVDVRLVTATNQNLEQAVEAGTFRKDLFYRISVFPIHLLPLRERKEDVRLLAHHFLLKHRGQVGKSVEGFTPAALDKLMSYDYPGNIRELENKIHHALVLCTGTLIGPQDVPLAGGRVVATATEMDLDRTFKELKREVVEGFEEAYTRQLLELCGGNLAAAARRAGMDRKNLWSMAKKYGIELGDIRERARTASDAT